MLDAMILQKEKTKESRVEDVLEGRIMHKRRLEILAAEVWKTFKVVSMLINVATSLSL